MNKRRGRPKKLDQKDSDDEDFNPYERAGRAKKVKIDEATAGEPSAPTQGDFKIKRKSKNSHTEGEKQTLDKQSLEQVLKTIKYSFEKPNIVKLFEDVMESTNDESIMGMLKHVLSAGYKAISEKRFNLKKRWTALKNSNVPEQEYRQKEKELKAAEIDEINEIREDLYNKLCGAKIVGFQTKEQIVDRIHMDLAQVLEEKSIDNPLVSEEIEEREHKIYKQYLFELIEKLLSEKTLTEDSRKLRYQKNKQREIRGQGNEGGDSNAAGLSYDNEAELAKAGFGISDLLVFNDGKQVISLSKYFGIAKNKRNHQANSQNSMHRVDLFGFMKEKTPEELVLFTGGDKNFMKKYEFQTLTDSANEKLIIDEQFLKTQRDQFVLKMRELDKNGPYRLHELDDKTFKEMMLVSNFIINSIHNVDKNEKYDLLIHPNDLVSLLDRFK